MTSAILLMILALSQTLCLCQMNGTEGAFVDLQEATKQYKNILEKFAALEQQIAQNLQEERQLREEVQNLHKHEDQLIEILGFQSKTLQGLLEENRVLRRELMELYHNKEYKLNSSKETHKNEPSEDQGPWFPTGPVIDAAWMFTTVANITQYTGTAVGNRHYQTQQATKKLVQELNNTKEFLCSESVEVPGVFRHSLRSSPSTAWLLQLAVLVESVRSGADHAARLLLLLGANPMIRQPKDPLLNPTALHWSAARGKANLTAALIHAGALVDARDKHNQTALHWAAGNGQFEVIKVLLDNGASRYAVTVSKWTPLHYAALKGHTEVAKLLLRGANEVAALLAARNDQERTAREVALSFGWLELAGWLLDQEQLHRMATTVPPGCLQHSCGLH